ncbi:hypothetical protein BS17DRAFT_791854 [Gyrodon lividus]|nr:hypothetical protein BS17DRAFT_791854 [Gyrodon lividus]
MVSRFLLSAAATALLTSTVKATCPGYNFGITQTDSDPKLDVGVWKVFDDSCKVVQIVVTNNPCTTRYFDCSPAPITFTGLHLDGLNYACRSDRNAGSCDGHALQVCCRNDGK